MNQHRLRSILEDVRAGRLDIEGASDRLRDLPYEEVGGFACVDHHRAVRQGMSEVVLAEGKTTEQVVAIVERLAAHGGPVLATRAAPAVYDAVRERVPAAEYNPLARTILVPDPDAPPGRPGILILTAGTADVPVAEEAAVTAIAMGNLVERVYDVGVAGIHRLLDRLDALGRARVIVVVAGMDGALPSVVGGLVDVPVIAVPTSVGYGAAFGGLSALLTMLTSCAAGITVVNIDNGFGAGFAAALINRLGPAPEPAP
ncbi:MAG TPA: nickel pincer cofactor biosynthesis protein LarB [Candidatus Limnocylindrales bacterium]|jgi:NCAIR mutase (PurE)-related protein